MSDAPGWYANAEKLRCLLLLDDGFAELFSPRAGTTFFRAFIVEDRATGEIRLNYRFRYKDPSEWSWVRGATEKRGQEGVEYFRHAMESVLRLASTMVGLDLPDDGVNAFFPPDDGGDFGSTIIWLEMRDLIEIRIDGAK